MGDYGGLMGDSKSKFSFVFKALGAVGELGDTFFYFKNIYRHLMAFTLYSVYGVL
jgi:hypothetical protein